MTDVSQPSPLAAAQHHAQALAATGDLDGAQLTLQYALETGRANLGEDDPAVLATAHQLATVHRQCGDASAARRVLEEAFAAGQWRLGDADPLMLSISFDLGVVAEELGNRHEARRAFGRVAGMGPAVLGDDHWAVQRARAYLGDDPPTVRLELPITPQEPAPAPEPDPAPAPRIAPSSPPPGSYQDASGSTPAPAPPATFHDSPRITPSAAPASAVAAAYPVDGGRGSRTRSAAVFASIAASIAAVIAVVALVLVLSTRDDGEGDDGGPDVPTLGGGRPPSDVRLRDVGSTVELSWTDPTDGTVSFMVTGGHPGELLKPMGQIGPGTTSLKLHGLNSALDYCFAVVAVYSASTFNTSPQTCTNRAGTTPEPSATG